MARHPQSHFLVVGEGPSEEAIRETFRDAGLEARLHVAGVLEREALAGALNAMDVFAFASKSETQGMVLTEAMAAGLPVVALDASGAREVVRDGHNGRLLREETPAAFGAALEWVHGRSEAQRRALVQAARDTAEAFSLERSADAALECFRRLHARSDAEAESEERLWEQVMGRIRAEWEILRSVTRAGDGAISERAAPGATGERPG
jgi:glycosyltransferase involved in cell wall biosynthesis